MICQRSRKSVLNPAVVEAPPCEDADRGVEDQAPFVDARRALADGGHQALAPRR
jgi:hypothetical protein